MVWDSAGPYSQFCTADGLLVEPPTGWELSRDHHNDCAWTLFDKSGTDVYEAEMNMAQGAGHDFTVGLLWDAAGDDTYRAPNLSLGGGNADGIGIFRDDSGDDTYEVEANTTLGRANSYRPGSLRFDLLCLGLFLDLGGRDTYPAAKDFAGNDRFWTQPPPQDSA
ncbi:MAG: hypothetical protein GY778_02055, partial [bacterium]|nr:hypothetical protein [bacterium]